MLCLLNVTDAESCLSASSRLGPFGLPHKLSESMKPQSPLTAQATPHFTPHNKWCEHFTIHCEDDCAYLRKSKITFNLMMRDTQSQTSAYSPRMWVFFLWNSSCCSIRRCHAPIMTYQFATSAPAGSGWGMYIHTWWDFLFWLRGHSLFLPVGLTPLFPGGRGRMVTRNKLRTILRWPDAWQPDPEANWESESSPPTWAWAGPREKYQGPMTHSLKQVSEASSFLSSQEALLYFANGYFSLEKENSSQWLNWA